VILKIPPEAEKAEQVGITQEQGLCVDDGRAFGCAQDGCRQQPAVWVELKSVLTLRPSSGQDF
jgi:hypothetical protein